MLDKETYKKLSKIKLIIFDMDGVLVDVSRSYIETILKTANHFCIGLATLDKINELKALGGFNNDWTLTIELIKRSGVRIKDEEVIEKFQSIYWGTNGNGLIQSETWLIKDYVLKKLFNLYKLAIFTGRPRQEALYTLKLNNAFELFNPIVAMEDVELEKPAPDGIYHILRFHKNIKEDEVLYIGDTVDDMQAAAKAGIHAIAIAPFNTAHIMREIGLAVINDINSLYTMLNMPK